MLLSLVPSISKKTDPGACFAATRGAVVRPMVRQRCRTSTTGTEASRTCERFRTLAPIHEPRRIDEPNAATRLGRVLKHPVGRAERPSGCMRRRLRSGEPAGGQPRPAGSACVAGGEPDHPPDHTPRPLLDFRTASHHPELAALRGSALTPGIKFSCGIQRQDGASLPPPRVFLLCSCTLGWCFAGVCALWEWSNAPVSVAPYGETCAGL